MSKILCLLVTVLVLVASLPPHAAKAAAGPDGPSPSWKIYKNTRFGFTLSYPPDWRLGEPLADGTGVTITPSVDGSQFPVTGFLNLEEGSSPDGRQTLEEFATAQHRTVEEYFGRKNMPVHWQKDRMVTLGGLTARQLSFSYRNENRHEMIEIYIFALGRSEGRGVRIKFPAERRTALMPVFADILQTYKSGRDQNALRPQDEGASK